MDYRIITAPVIIPDQYDCDQNKGEPPLTREQIRNLKTTFDNDYQFIDYDHNLLNKTSPWYMKLVGEVQRSWITRKPTTYTNILGNEETIPSGTWWLTSRVTDPTMIQMIDDKLVTAYSITVGNKAFCDDMKRIIQTAPKNNTENTILDTAGLVATKNKTLIKDIINPVGFTVSLTGIPCVGSATFSKTCYEKQNKKFIANKNGGKTMTEPTENKFSISELLGIKELFANKNDEENKEETRAPEKEPEEPKQDEEFVTKEEFTETIDKTNKKIDNIDKKMEKILEKLDPKKEDEEEEEEEDKKSSEKEPEDDEEAKDKTANKNNPPQSSQLDNTDDINNTANKNNKNTKSKLMESLNRKPNGEYKFPRRY